MSLKLPRRLAQKKDLRILITRTDRIGDAVLTTPVYAAIRKVYPQAHIAAMCLPGPVEVLEGNPSINEILVYEKGTKHKRWWGAMLYGFELRKKKFDIVIHLHPTNRMHLLTFFAAIPVRVGYQSKARWFLTHSLPETKRLGKKHESQYNFDLLEILGIRCPDPIKLEFYLTEKSKQHFDALLREEKVVLPPRFFVINPSASCPSRCWPPERFAAVGNRFYTKYGLVPVLISDRVNKSLTEAVIQKLEVPYFDFTGKLNLKDIGELFSHTAFLISNDTGPAHIAAALDVPVLAIFGRLNPGISPTRWRPLGEKSFFLHNPPDCNPCLAHNCQINFECLTNIHVDDVVQLIEAKKEVFRLAI